jgi:hypothetical protein
MTGHGSGQRPGRRVRDVLPGLRRRYGVQTPSYQKFWAATQDGRIASRREGAFLVIDDDDETIAEALGLEPSRVAA